MTGDRTDRFQILALSGGGFRGLYTARVLERIEDTENIAIGSRFNLLAGTSVGGIIALALALEIPAKRIVGLFEEHGDSIFKQQGRWGIRKSLHSPTALRKLLGASDLFGEKVLGDCLHPVIIPTINYTTGTPKLFKSPHHQDFRTDHRYKLVDIALATSAAPIYFPRHKFESWQFVDGGLFANAPGQLALHEAEIFFKQPLECIHLVSIGTMSSRLTVDTKHSTSGGMWDWAGGLNLKNGFEKLFSLSISVSETLTENMLRHRLNDRYMHVDDTLTNEQAKSVGLNKTTAAAREVLVGRANQKFQEIISNTKFREYLTHSPEQPIFYYGPNASEKV